jgi:hypothetical protein
LKLLEFNLGQIKNVFNERLHEETAVELDSEYFGSSLVRTESTLEAVVESHD